MKKTKIALVLAGVMTLTVEADFAFRIAAADTNEVFQKAIQSLIKIIFNGLFEGQGQEITAQHQGENRPNSGKGH